VTVPHSPPRPIAAVLTDRLDDIAVAGAAALREAAALHGGPPVHTAVPALRAPLRATARRPLSDAPEPSGTTPR
jgi:hypothetical protein